MPSRSIRVSVRLSCSETLEFEGECLARVVALDHDDTVRRQFCVYAFGAEFVAERVDYPDTLDVRFWGARCSDNIAIYDFFGNEPLANFLYGALGISVPGLRRL